MLYIALGHELPQPVEKLRLAMEAAGAVVCAVGRIVELASFYELMTNPDLGSEPGGIVALGLGQTWRNGGYGQRPVAEGIERHLCQEGAVDAA